MTGDKRNRVLTLCKNTEWIITTITVSELVESISDVIII